MTLTYSYTELMPAYSLPYLINNDSSGLDPEDIARIDQFMQFYYDMAGKINASVIISPEEEESQFTWNPAFGKACDCISCAIVILADQPNNSITAQANYALGHKPISA